MRVLIATPLYPPEPGGPATHTRLLEQGLPKRGIRVDVAKFSEVRRYPKLVRHVVYLVMLMRRARDADLVLVQDTVSCGVPAALAARLCGVPLIVRVPGDYAWEQGRQRFGVTEDLDSFQRDRALSLQVRFLRMLQSWTTGQARLVIVPSHYFASIVSQWGVAPDRLQVIYHGLPESRDISMPETTPDRPFMVSIGRLVPWKGFAFLIGLLQKLPEWRLVIVGDGPDRRMLEREALLRKVGDRVTFTGAVPHAEALGWCSSADTFVLNTSFESFSFQVLEAMALGVPIITTAIGSIPELITDRKEGLLLRPDDAEGMLVAVRSVRDEPDTWAERRTHARHRARDFSVDRMLDETARQLASIV